MRLYPTLPHIIFQRVFTYLHLHFQIFVLTPFYLMLFIFWSQSAVYTIRVIISAFWQRNLCSRILNFYLITYSRFTHQRILQTRVTCFPFFAVRTFSTLIRLPSFFYINSKTLNVKSSSRDGVDEKHSSNRFSEDGCLSQTLTRLKFLIGGLA